MLGKPTKTPRKRNRLLLLIERVPGGLLADGAERHLHKPGTIPERLSEAGAE